MIQDVKKYIQKYVDLDTPIPFKGLLIYPIYMSEYYDFEMAYDILCINKDSIPDINIIQMSYLDFLFKHAFLNATMINSNYSVGMYYMEKFRLILCMCCKLEAEQIQIIQESGKFILILNGVRINSQEFDELRRIILYQNLHDYSEEYVDPEVRKAVEDFYASKNKGIVMPQLEDKMAAISAVTGLTKKHFKEMTFREFDLLFEKCKRLVDYQIQATAAASGMVKYEKPIEDWIYHKPHNPYEQVFSSYDNFKDKVQNN